MEQDRAHCDAPAAAARRKQRASPRHLLHLAHQRAPARPSHRPLPDERPLYRRRDNPRAAKQAK